LEIVINGRFVAQPVTGVQRVAHEITHAIDRLLDEPGFRGVHVRLVVPTGRNHAFGLRNIQVETAAGGSGHLWEQLILPRHLKGATLLCLCNSAPVENLLRRTPMAVMLHDQAYRLFPADYSPGYRIGHHLVERLILTRAGLVLTVSEAERRTLQSTNHVRSRIMVTPNGSWMQDARPGVLVLDRPVTDGYGLYIGSFSERKNIGAVLATATALARQRGRKFRFVGPANAMSAAVEAAVPTELRSLITFHGYMPDGALADLYGGADFLLYPSFYEASGLPPSEAMTFGCPVILSDLPVMRERCGDAALYCDPHDHQAIIDAASRLLDEPGLANEMALRGRVRAATFTWERQAALILEAVGTKASQRGTEPTRSSALKPRQAGEARLAIAHPHAPK
jgi:glycosyltransferase involved in cell wall biosynthesis